MSLDSFERIPLLFGASPVHRLERLSEHLGGKVEIWAKREDCNSGLAYGGNKTRKLEYVAADALGDTFTDKMVERIDVRLGSPERCPHGWPVDPSVEQAENQELAPLSDLGVGSRATIVRLAEHDGELLHWFYDQGLVPGTQLEVGKREIGEKAAAGLFVRRDPL